MGISESTAEDNTLQRFVDQGYRVLSGPEIVIDKKGNPGVVTWSSRGFFPIETTFYIKPEWKVSGLYFLFYTLKAQNLPCLNADSAVPGLNRSLVHINRILVPSESALSIFNLQLACIFERIESNHCESFTIANVRDKMLLLLLSGKIIFRDLDHE